MKIKMMKKGMTRWCQQSELDQFMAAGWRPADEEQVREEIIRLRPPVKSRATAKKALEEATLTIKGDE